MDISNSKDSPGPTAAITELADELYRIDMGTAEWTRDLHNLFKPGRREPPATGKDRSSSGQRAS